MEMNKREAESSLHWESSVNAALVELTNALIDPERSIQELADVVLDCAKRLSESEHGFVSSIDPQSGINVGHTLTQMMDQCQVAVEAQGISFPPDPDGRFPGLYGHALNTGEAFYTNTPETHKSSQGTPEGHIPLRNFLTAPAMIGEKPVGQIAVANSMVDYTDQHLEAIQRLAQLYAVALNRRQIEIALLESEARLSAFVDALPDLAFIYDKNGMYVDILTQQEHLLYQEAAQLKERLIHDVLPEPVAEQLLAAIHRSIESRTTQTVEYSLDVPAGSRRFEGSFSPMQTDPGEIEKVVLIARDVTDRKQADEALRESEERFRNTFAQAAVGLSHTAPDGRFLRVNRRFCEITGYSPQEMLNLRYQDITHPEDVGLDLENVQRLLKSEIYGFSNEKRYLRKDGTTIWVNLTVSLVRDATGEPKYLIGVIEDISQRKQAEEALRTSEEQYRTLFENAPIGIYRTTPDGEILEANPALIHMLGFDSFEDLSARNLEQNGFTMEQPRQLFKTLIESTGEVRGLEYSWTRRDGTVIFIRENASVGYGDDGRVLYYEGTVEDISERKKAEQALVETNKTINTIMDSIQADIYVANLETHEILFMNRHMRDSFGGDYTGQICYQAFRGESKSCSHCNNERLLDEEGQPTGLHIWEGRNPITGIWYENHDQAVRWHDGRYVRMEIAFDISERLQAQAEREHLLSQVREIMRTVPEGVMLLDAEGHIVLANPTAVSDLASLADTEVGDKLTHLGESPLKDLLTSPPRGLWHEVQAGERTFEIIARPMANGPQPEHWVMVMRNVTQEREIQKGIQQQERLAAVGQLAAGIAHDFNNILAVIMLYSDLLLNSAEVGTSDLGPRGHERLHTISQQAKRASDLIQQILDFSRSAVIEPRPMDLLPFMKEQVKLLKRALPENIKIHLDGKDDDYMIKADPTRLQQAVMNLAVNARDAMPEGGELNIKLSMPAPSDEIHCITCGQMLEGIWVRIDIQDTGKGISEDLLEHIFEPFFTTKSPGQGTGLGLAQVYGIISQHEGHVEVQTQMGHGSTFSLYLPALLVEKERSTDLLSGIMPDGQGQTILVVEDEAATRQAMVEGLGLLNYRVLAVADGHEALSFLEEQADEVDLVLSDVVMPDMGGIALFHTLKEKGYSVPVILMSGHPMQEELQKLQAEGLLAWILKPLNLRQLAETIAQVLTVG